jgi:NCAIR mutase (PurE)-related protein
MSKRKGFADLGFAKVDLDRAKRCGAAEVIFGLGKTPEQVTAIALKLKLAGQPVLVTRTCRKTFNQVKRVLDGAAFHPQARLITWKPKPLHRKQAFSKDVVAVCAAGTSDLPIAEEAAGTLEFYGHEVKRIYDVGVAGIHRLLAAQDRIRQCSVIIVVAGMEGALPSAVAGLMDKPVIAVPTSVGYGASFDGLAALLGMLNSCGSGVTVVNIDNGFGAAYAARQILRLKKES